MFTSDIPMSLQRHAQITLQWSQFIAVKHTNQLGPKRDTNVYYEIEFQQDLKTYFGNVTRLTLDLLKIQKIAMKKKKAKKKKKKECLDAGSIKKHSTNPLIQIASAFAFGIKLLKVNMGLSRKMVHK